MASWVRGKCIGKGAFGSVSVGVSKSDGRVFAVKSVDRQTGLPGQLEALENEIRILRQLSESPYVVGFLGDDVTFEEGATTSYRNLHMEYLPGGTVADMAPRNGGKDADVDEQLIRYYTWCLVQALRYVHSKGVVHCDVKGRNVLVGPNGGIAKLADFGSAVPFGGSGIKKLPRGSPLWMAPEVIRGESQGPESDVWSLGCTVIEMVTGKPAWEDRGVDTLIGIGYSGDFPEFPGQLSELGRDFLEKCLRREPSQRWSCDQLLQHPFLSSIPPNKLVESSPRCVLDWVNSDFSDEDEEEEIGVDTVQLAKDRIGKFATSIRVNWESDDWLAVRTVVSDTEPTTTEAGNGAAGYCAEEGEGTNWEYSDLSRVEREEEGTSWEGLDSTAMSTIKNEGANPEMLNFGGWSSTVWLYCIIAGWSCRMVFGDNEGKLSCTCFTNGYM
ncbi:hypothetical protein L6164_026025 [Bauhinia variegata]|uniref:Uncharacterized protein n=1 Tax=Bauhinia variegata TaxID=167791 RepID=A0ACB9M3Y8_BAUVA|nr:hypothetical protein L6164_026025 [Bauhinia variegata]